MGAGNSKCKSVFRKFIYIPLFVFLLTSFAYGQDDAMETSIKSIWPDKNVKVYKNIGNIIGTSITSYSVTVDEGGYEYLVTLHILPDYASEVLRKKIGSQPVESKEYQVKNIDPPVWITRAGKTILVDTDRSKRKNLYIIQKTVFRCGNTYITTTVLKDSGSSQSDPSFQNVDSPKSKEWTAKLLPVSKDFAQKVAQSLGCCPNGVRAGTGIPIRK
ncbi:MAG: hypothetical protein O7C70_04135 [Candidatus Dadabacteria bacterium]|nr:hypothetical protein [Candidatus Dadabacteria bacterium]